MIIKQVHIPQAYFVSSDDQGNLASKSLIAALRDVKDAGVLLVDPGGAMMREMRLGLATWSTDNKKGIQELLKQLVLRKRFVVPDVTYSAESGLPDPCAHAVGIARVSTPEVTVMPKTCICRSECISSASACQVDAYLTHDACEQVRQIRHVSLAYNQWSRVKVNQEIWNPVMTYAKHVKIIDRWIGRHVVDSGVLRPGFRDGLEWVVEQYAKNSVRRASGLFEIITGFGPRPASGSDRRAAKILQQFGEQLTRQYGHKIDFVFKRESDSSQLPHSRYLFTDQVALVIDPGMDLLSRGHVRAMSVTHVAEHDRAKAETEVLRVARFS